MAKTPTIASVPHVISQFIQEVRQELKKVQWPTRQETIRSTIVILVVSFVVAAATGLVDYALTWIVETVLLRF